MKKLLCLTMAALMLLSGLSLGAFAADITATLNGEVIELGAEPIVRGDEVFVPLRSVSDAAGYTVGWNEESRSVTVINGGNAAEIKIGEAEVRMNGRPYTTTAEAFIEGKRTYVPLSALDIMGVSSKWDGSSKLELTVDKLNGKFYQIIQVSSGKAFTLENGNLGDGVRVVLGKANENDDLQLWQLNAKGNGRYAVINKKSRRSFDIPNERLDPELNLIQYGVTEGPNQFIIPQKQSDGNYMLLCAHAVEAELYLSVMPEGNIAQNVRSGDETQIFELREVKTEASANVGGAGGIAVDPDPWNGKFASLINKDGQALAADYNGALTLAAKENGDEKVWRLIRNGDGYTIVNKKTGNSYAAEGSAKDGLAVHGIEGSFALADALISPDGYADDAFGGMYVKITEGDKAVSVADESDSNGARIALADPSDSDYQLWAFVPQGNNMYSIINKASGRSFDIPASSEVEGASLTQYDNNGGNNQIFEIRPAGDAYYLKNKHSKLYVTAGEDGLFTQMMLGRNDHQSFKLTVVGENDIKTIGAAATLFLLKGEETVSNAKIQWASVSGAGCYDVYRSVDGGDYKFLTAVTGNTVDDYGLEVGKSYRYAVYAVNDGTLIDCAETPVVKPYDLPANLKSSSNLQESGLDRPNTLYVDGVYYRFYERGGGQEWKLMMTTSTDDITYSEPVEVLNAAEILAHETCKDFQSARFESQNFVYNPIKNKFAFIAHFEADGGYGTARTSIATATPGERFTFHGAVRPDGGDTRDLNVYVDDDYSAYVIAAINVNADLALYKLNEDWSGFEGFVCFVNRNSHRELPSMLKVDGKYYLFTSGTAGWYPTQGMYNTADSIEGPWSGLKVVGNTTTFSSQSGPVFKLKEGSTNYIMSTYRWMYFWQDAIVKRTNNRRYPITVSDGFAFYDFYDELLYNWDNDVLVPVQNGRILSQDMPVVTESAGRIGDGAGSNDGNYQTYWRGDLEGLEADEEAEYPLGWPYTWEVDLGEVRGLSEMQISWLIWNGSEPYYSYKLEGSTDGKSYTTILDNTEGYTDYGFTVDQLSAAARYVRLTVTNAKPRSSNENFYPPQLYEVKILGK